MKLLEIKNIEYEDTAVYYRQKYEAVAVFENAFGAIVEVPIFFVIEINPLGEKQIKVELKKTVDYPLIPLLRMLREKISEMHAAGALF